MYDEHLKCIENWYRQDFFGSASGAERIDLISQSFLHSPYLLSACGEGLLGTFDQNPLVRVDAFDCVTYVNLVCALFISDSFKQFQENIIRINYRNSSVDYLQRLHFTCIDWNVENEKNNILRNITETIVDANGQPIFKIASAYINKTQWLLKHKIDSIRVRNVDLVKRENLLKQLHASVDQLSNAASHLSYIPIEYFSDESVMCERILDQLPNFGVLEIVRPSWDLRASIGTHLNISHVGIFMREDREFVFRHASSIAQRVVEVPLLQCLIECRKSPTIGGVHFCALL